MEKRFLVIRKNTSGDMSFWKETFRLFVLIEPLFLRPGSRITAQYNPGGGDPVDFCGGIYAQEETE